MISAHTRLAAVLGWPVEHSRSPALHNAAYRALGVDAVYLALAVAPGRLATALAAVPAFHMLGVNITVPHKQEALRLCDEVDERARTIGAVNTVVPRDGRLHGANTDVDGFADALRDALGGEALAGRRALVLGAGGAARAVTLALAGQGAQVTVIARTPERGRELIGLGALDILPWTPAACAEQMGEARVLVDATSAPLGREGEARLPARVPIEALPAGALVCSLVYHREPALLAEARARGLPTMDGRGMLIHQAARAFELMTGKAAPIDEMKAAFDIES